MFNRLPDWPERLAALITTIQNKPFRWGMHDCALLAANVILALTGKDIAYPWRGYTTAKEAKAILQQAGGLVGLAAQLASTYQFPEVPPLQARRGDICLLQIKRIPMLGVCLGTRIACPGEAGLIFYPLSHAKRAWSI